MHALLEGFLFCLEDTSIPFMSMTHCTATKQRQGSQWEENSEWEALRILMQILSGILRGMPYIIHWHEAWLTGEDNMRKEM